MGAPPITGATKDSMPAFEPADGSDWEYEYDETQTEDFYFTLDLPATAEPVSKRRKTNTAEKQTPETTEPGLGPTRSQDTINRDTSHQSQAQSEPISLTGLHTSTPVVEYGNQRYDCRWTTDLGTQFHVARPGDVKDPYRAGHAVDVVALSRVRLTGQRTTATAHSKTVDAAGTSVGQAIDVDEEEDDEEVEARPQMSFFERVKEMQLRKEREGVNGINGVSAENSVPPRPHSLSTPSDAVSADAAGVTQMANEERLAETSREETTQLPPTMQTASVSERLLTDGAQNPHTAEAPSMQGNDIASEAPMETTKELT